MPLKKLPHVDSFVKALLRNASTKWPGKNIAEQRANVQKGKGVYKCEKCGSLLKYTKVRKVIKGKERDVRTKTWHMDHIDPVVPLTGQKMREDDPTRIDFNPYIDRLFIPPEGYNLLCIPCHESKTSLEDSMRDYYNPNRRKRVRKAKKLVKSCK